MSEIQLPDFLAAMRVKSDIRNQRMIEYLGPKAMDGNRDSNGWLVLITGWYKVRI